MTEAGEIILNFLKGAFLLGGIGCVLLAFMTEAGQCILALILMTALCTYVGSCI